MIKPRPLLELSTCSLEPNYHFYGNCIVSTCLYYSEKCKFHCIKLGTNALSNTDNKSLSVSEIVYYKYNSLNRALIKAITQEKKESINRIQHLYLFYSYLDYLRQEYFDYRIILHSKIQLKSKFIMSLLSKYPFNLKVLYLVPADLVLLFSENNYYAYCKSKKVKLKMDFITFLNLSENELIKARRILKKHLLKKEINHEFD